MQNERLSYLIGKIYDCAVDPEQWQDALTAIRDELKLAFVSTNYMDFSPTYPATPPDMITFITDWDMEWIEALGPLVPLIPHFDAMKGAEIDEPVSQLSLIDEAAFRKTEFYHKWVGPQGLRDTCNINIIKRERQNAMLSATIRDGRDILSEDDIHLLHCLSPHMRRAMLISDMIDESRSWIQIYNSLLDKISAAIFLVGRGGVIRYHNGAAETLLSKGTTIVAPGGRLTAKSPMRREGFETAIERACIESDLEIGSWGNGLTLPSDNGDSSVAYVLPLGLSERRRALGPGLAAVFVATDKSSEPPVMEVLSALSGMTIAEAKVAIAITQGKSTEDVALEADISIHTLRKHLANIYTKTGARSQTALAAFVNRLSLPVE